MRLLNLALAAAFTLPILSACTGDQGIVIPIGTVTPTSETDQDTKRLVKLVVTFPSGNGTETEYFYDGAGHLTTVQSSRNEQLETLYRHTTDADGRLLETDRDTNGDGVTDQTVTYRYDENGLVRWYGQTPDGTYNWIRVVDFENGYPVSIRYQNIDSTTSIDMIDEFSGERTRSDKLYYETQYIVVKEVYEGESNALDRSVFYTYNPDGTMASSVLVDPSGVILNSATYEYEDGDCSTNTYNLDLAYFCVVPIPQN